MSIAQPYSGVERDAQMLFGEFFRTAVSAVSPIQAHTAKKGARHRSEPVFSKERRNRKSCSRLADKTQ
jgi:hypothetical protein